MSGLSAGEQLTGEHHQIDRGMDAALNGQGGHAELLAALRLLREHIFREEVVLFPPLADEGLAMPIFVMKREHGLMWPLIRRLEADCQAGMDLASLRNGILDLSQQLAIHNSKEEQIIYSAADRLNASNTDWDLERELDRVDMPDDWNCAMVAR